MEEGWMGQSVSECQGKECMRWFPYRLCGQSDRSVMAETDAPIKGREKVRCVRVEGAGEAEEKLQGDGRDCWGRGRIVQGDGDVESRLTWDGK